MVDQPCVAKQDFVRLVHGLDCLKKRSGSRGREVSCDYGAFGLLEVKIQRLQEERHCLGHLVQAP